MFHIKNIYDKMKNIAKKYPTKFVLLFGCTIHRRAGPGHTKQFYLKANSKNICFTFNSALFSFSLFAPSLIRFHHSDAYALI